MIRYFVSYAYFHSGSIGTGGWHISNMTIERDQPIGSHPDIIEIESHIGRNHKDSAGISLITWQRFEEE